MDLGSGAAMAMPVWAEYMQKVTATPGLLNVVNEWPAPQSPLNLEIDCSKFESETEEKLDFMEGG
jgi:membrane carboxypeptidase/penicillin-binding protein